MSGMDNDLFTYEVEVVNILCDSNKDDDSEQRVSHEADDDTGYDSSDVAFTEWLGSKKFNYKIMDHYIKKALWIYYIRGDDDVTDEEFSDNEVANHPIVTIPLLPDFWGVTDGTRAKNPSSLSDIHARVFPDPYLLFRLIMPPRRFKKKSVRKIVEKRVAKAIEKYEKTRANSNNTGGSGSTNTGGTVVPEMHGCSYKTFMNGKPHGCSYKTFMNGKPHGCSYKTFMNGKPHSFKGTKGVVGLKCWFEKMEQVFEICKCAEDDKVKFAMCTFEGRALTWWNGNVQTLGLANANQIP
ncbi:hypothetical protein Tco_0904763 [Tanacetum coccineum]